jgi:hypothetical protein
MNKVDEDKETISVTDLDLATFLSAKQETFDDIREVGGETKAFVFNHSDRCERLVNKYRFGSEINDPDLEVSVHVFVRTRSDLLSKLKLKSFAY